MQLLEYHIIFEEIKLFFNNFWFKSISVMFLCLTLESHITTIVRHPPFPNKKKKKSRMQIFELHPLPLFFFIYFLEFWPLVPNRTRANWRRESFFSFLHRHHLEKKGKQESSLMHTHMQTSLAAIERGGLKIFSRERRSKLISPARSRFPSFGARAFCAKVPSLFLPAADGGVERCSVLRSINTFGKFVCFFPSTNNCDWFLWICTAQRISYCKRQYKRKAICFRIQQSFTLQARLLPTPSPFPPSPVSLRGINKID